jgi:hypothetical protein
VVESVQQGGGADNVADCPKFDDQNALCHAIVMRASGSILLHAMDAMLFVRQAWNPSLEETAVHLQ